MLTELCWPAPRVVDALAELARRSRLAPDAGPTAALPRTPDAVEGERLGRWVERAAAALGVEAEEVEISYAEVDAALARVAPALIRLADGANPVFLAILRRRGNSLISVGPDLREHVVSLEQIRGALVAKLEQDALPQVDNLLKVARTSPRTVARARQFLLAERLAAVRLSGLWLLRPAPTAPFWKLLRSSATPRIFGWLLAAHSGQYALMVGAWFMIARSLRHEEASVGWLAGWALVMVSALSLRMVSGWAAGRLALEVGTVLRRRLLVGTLYLAPDETRHHGLGDLLGRVVDAEIVEQLGSSGAVLAVTAGVELAVAIAILTAGAAPVAHPVWLIASIGAFAAMWPRYLRGWELASSLRLTMTDGVLEGIVGHQTRLAQQPPDQWHEREDQTLREYFAASQDMDRLATAAAVLPRVWLVAAVALLTPAFAATDMSTPAVAFSLGGVLLAYRTLVRMVAAQSGLAATVMAWTKMEPLMRATPSRSGTLETLTIGAQPPADGKSGPVVVAEHLAYRYERKPEPVLVDCNFSLSAGDRVMLQGASGSGKSTLCAVLAGVREPTAGLLLVEGLDQGTLGQDEWRRRVVAAPQFHDNHIFSATLAFNLLMGRRWPPAKADVDEAMAVCRGLGLGPLIERMPGGMMQMVGDMGWQLSHGEKSRVFIARTLLQDTRLIILDESLAALDPETLALCAGTVLARAPALVLIAHP